MDKQHIIDVPGGWHLIPRGKGMEAPYPGPSHILALRSILYDRVILSIVLFQVLRVILPSYQTWRYYENPPLSCWAFWLRVSYEVVVQFWLGLQSLKAWKLRLKEHMAGQLGLTGWFPSMGASPQDYVTLVIWQLTLCRVGDLRDQDRNCNGGTMQGCG